MLTCVVVLTTNASPELTPPAPVHPQAAPAPAPAPDPAAAAATPALPAVIEKLRLIFSVISICIFTHTHTDSEVMKITPQMPPHPPLAAAATSDACREVTRVSRLLQLVCIYNKRSLNHDAHIMKIA